MSSLVLSRPAIVVHQLNRAVASRHLVAHATIRCATETTPPTTKTTKHAAQYNWNFDKPVPFHKGSILMRWCFFAGSPTCHITRTPPQHNALFVSSPSKPSIDPWARHVPMVGSMLHVTPLQPLLQPPHAFSAVCYTDQAKVAALMESIEEIGLQEPVCVLLDGCIHHWWTCRCMRRGICEAADMYDKHPSLTQIDVLEVEGKYYGFSGCHRFEVLAHAFMTYTPTEKSAPAPPMPTTASTISGTCQAAQAHHPVPSAQGYTTRPQAAYDVAGCVSGNALQTYPFQYEDTIILRVCCLLHHGTVHTKADKPCHEHHARPSMGKGGGRIGVHLQCKVATGAQTNTSTKPSTCCAILLRMFLWW